MQKINKKQNSKQLPLINNSFHEGYQLLSNFCKELDPYQPLTQHQLSILEIFNIPYSENPFELTNNLLQKLMELEEALDETQ